MMRRLADLLPEEWRERPIALDDLEGVECEISGYTEREGEHGKYVIIHLKTEDGRVHRVATGATLITTALGLATAADAFPIRARFVKHGRMWTIE